MNVKELKEILATLDDDCEVVMGVEGESGIFHKVSDVDSKKLCEPKNDYWYTIHAKEPKGANDCKPCVILLEDTSNIFYENIKKFGSVVKGL